MLAKRLSRQHDDICGQRGYPLISLRVVHSLVRLW